MVVKRVAFGSPGLDLEAGIVEPDACRDYGEDRYRALVLLDGRLHVACFCVRGDAIRVISPGQTIER